MSFSLSLSLSLCVCVYIYIYIFDFLSSLLDFLQVSGHTPKAPDKVVALSKKGPIAVVFHFFYRSFFTFPTGRFWGMSPGLKSFSLPHFLFPLSLLSHTFSSSPVPSSHTIYTHTHTHTHTHNGYPIKNLILLRSLSPQTRMEFLFHTHTHTHTHTQRVPDIESFSSPISLSPDTYVIFGSHTHTHTHTHTQ